MSSSAGGESADTPVDLAVAATVVPVGAVDSARLQSEIEKLATFTDDDPPAVTRILWTPTDVSARRYVKGLFQEAGLEVREDALGNMWARWPGWREKLPPVVTGSHIDAIPHAGRFDGVVGVLGALEAFRALKRCGYVPFRSLEILLFTAEEPTRFGIGCLGSRALSGALTPAQLSALKDEHEIPLDAARAAAGYLEPLSQVKLLPNAIHSFVELHIEQGPLLDWNEIAIGIVTAIAAPATLRVSLTGEGGHAGAVLMPDRRDALTAAAEVVLGVEKAANTSGSPDTVATTGVLRVHPGAVNSIPSRVEMEIDVRDIDEARRDDTVGLIEAAVSDVCRRRNLMADVRVVNADPPAACAPAVQEATLAAARSLGLPSRKMVSRAYHDTLFMSRVCPVGMIFIPCRHGISHRPDEFTTPEEIARGVAVLAGTLARLASEGADEGRR